MVVPLIIGAARVTKMTAKGVSKGTRKTRGGSSQKQNHIIKRRELQQGMREARRRSREKNANEQKEEGSLKTLIGHPLESKTQHSKRIYNKLQGKGTSKLKRGRRLSHAFMILGSIIYPMSIQTIFAVITIASLAVEENWWGWVIPGITMATIAYVVAVLLGTYTIIIAAFALAKELADIKVVLIFIFCFSANWVPGLQIVPWAGIWIVYIIFRKK